ncbi:MAG TPA: type III secretion system protein SctP [Trinickia sp.]|jgi:hypothetical protein|nr:type III secretion system protein SctP [Trinickia sp.]
MHSSAPHRARIIAGPSPDTHHAQATSSPKLRRQGELFRQLRANAGVRHHEDGRAYEDAESSTEPDAGSSLADAVSEQPQDDGNEQGSGQGSGGSGDSGQSDQSGQSGESGDSDASGSHCDRSFEWFASTEARLALAAAHAAFAARGAAPRAGTVSAAAPVDAPRDARKFIESIVSQVADFSSNPAVLARGEWHITVPIDPALLPDCTLSLTLSYFDLRLRFDTASERSRQLILLHETALRKSLEQVVQSRFDAPRSIEITVT